VLNHADAEHNVELLLAKRQSENVCLRDSMAGAWREVLCVRIDRAGQVDRSDECTPI
jgi:hypothetical protein